MTHHIGYIYGQSASRSPHHNSVGAGPDSSKTPTTSRLREPGQSRGRTAPPSDGGECQRHRHLQHFVTALSTSRLIGKPVLRKLQDQPFYRPFLGSRVPLLIL